MAGPQPAGGKLFAMSLPAAEDVSASRPASPAYCRGCGYSLRGLAGGECAECGRGFELGDRRTFAERPPRLRLRRWVRRTAELVVALVIWVAMVWAGCWWGWRAEQKTIDALRRLRADVKFEQIEADWPARQLPERWAFLRDRAVLVWHDGLTAAEAERLDLRPLGSVQTVSLTHSHVGDPMLARLRGLTEIRRLFLCGNPLDGSGLAHLRGCRRLEVLDLRRTGLTDAGMVRVGRLVSLRRLEIAETGVTDAGMAHVARLTSLQSLDLQHTAVTDAGLRRLHGLTALRSVAVTGSKVTEQGKRELRAALPNVMFDD